MARFRTYTLSTGRVVFAGKNEGNNDELVRETKRNETMLHTEKPGSPFVNAREKPNKQELKEAATICAKHSQDWRDNKQNVKINIFLRAHMKKGLFTKAGTWKVSKQENITIKKEDIKKFEEQQEHDSKKRTR